MTVKIRPYSAVYGYIVRYKTLEYRYLSGRGAIRMNSSYRRSPKSELFSGIRSFTPKFLFFTLFMSFNTVPMAARFPSPDTVPALYNYIYQVLRSSISIVSLYSEFRYESLQFLFKLPEQSSPVVNSLRPPLKF